MPYVYKYTDGSYLTDHAGTSLSLQNAVVGSTSTLGGLAGRLTILRKRKGFDRLLGRPVPVRITLLEVTP